uniref:DUF1428 family protein n=1 Tax=Coralloluteibacterium stylophorae TaxID=1776034 RepID=A0A8J8AYJ0_9GAMM
MAALRDGGMVVLARIVHPSRAARDAIHAGVTGAPRVQAMGGAASFDSRRTAHGGFEPLVGG